MAGYSDLKGEFKEDYRKNDRVLVLSDTLASTLWSRIEPCLTRRGIYTFNILFLLITLLPSHDRYNEGASDVFWK